MKATGNLLGTILDLGREMMVTGAEVWRVEDMLEKLFDAYCFKDWEVWVVSSCLAATVYTWDDREYTQIRIIKGRNYDLDKLEREHQRRLLAIRRQVEDASAPVGELNAQQRRDALAREYTRLMQDVDTQITDPETSEDELKELWELRKAYARQYRAELAILNLQIQQQDIETAKEGISLRLAAVKGLGGRGAQRLRLGKPYVDAPCKERQRGGDVQDQAARKGLGRQQAGLVAECDARTAGARIAGRHAVRAQEGCSGRMGGLHHHPAVAGIGSRQVKVAQAVLGFPHAEPAGSRAPEQGEQCRIVIHVCDMGFHVCPVGLLRRIAAHVLVAVHAAFRQHDFVIQFAPGGRNDVGFAGIGVVLIEQDDVPVPIPPGLHPDEVEHVAQGLAGETRSDDRPVSGTAEPHEGLMPLTGKDAGQFLHVHAFGVEMGITGTDAHGDAGIDFIHRFTQAPAEIGHAPAHHVEKGGAFRARSAGEEVADLLHVLGHKSQNQTLGGGADVGIVWSLLHTSIHRVIIICSEK